MSHNYKGNGKSIFVFSVVAALAMLTFYSGLSETRHFVFHNSLNVEIYNDTVPLKNDTIPVLQPSRGAVVVSSSQRVPDTTVIPVIDTFSFRSSADGLDAPVNYYAEDSVVMDVPGEKFYLYGKGSNVKYKDNDLEAPQITFDQNTNLVSAYLVRDSLGQVVAMPTFKQGDFSSTSDTIFFNMKTGKGITKSTYTQQGEMYVYGEKIKKVSPDVFYALRGRFTTCNLDTPHFAFVSSKIKFINEKMAYSGPVHPEFEGVPVPVYLPFGIFPLRQGRHSGLIAPSFTANEQLGLALEGLGYYKILSDNWDVVARGTIYSYGGWTANVSPRYFKRYRYQGNLSLDLQRFKTNFKGDPDYSSSRTFNIRWSHNADMKARPGVTFSANVNAGSSKFNSQVPNSPQRNFTNQMQSSITWSKVWKDKPYNLSVSANHNQNTTQRRINLNLPDVAFNLNTQYPFRRREPTGSYRWYENLGIALNTTARSLTTFIDTAGNIGKQMIDNLQWGANHNIPITLSLPQIGPLQVSPTVSYQERWYQQRLTRSWNPDTRKVDTVLQRGLFTARDMQFGMGASTRIFGMFTFGQKSKVSAIRHEIRPNISVNYKPNLNKHNYYDSQIDTFGNVARFSVYEGTVYGPFGEGTFGGLAFGVDNNLSMKVRNRKDTAEAALRKVSLIDGFSINGSYNFLADSFRFGGINLNLRSNLFNKINITANAMLDPYLTNSRGERIDKLVWTERPSLGRLTTGNVSVQSSFRGGDKQSPGENTVSDYPKNVDASGFPLDDYQMEAAYINNNPGQYADFSIPWSVDFSYSLRFQRTRKADYSGFTTRFFQDVNWNSSVNLTPRWKIGVTGFYNITDNELGTISMYLSREMHCWQMAINLSPVGRFRFFNITISPKSPILRDLKINRTRYFYDL